jgi:demethylmenaquinone methyltransferase/2-methoxy-6-polyprenyl-1,4-benzoquinol methylase
MPTEQQSRRGAMERSDQVQRMFDRIVPRYDLMNRLMTGGRDEAWRKRVARLAVATAVDGQRARILDVATGTGDLAFAMEKLGGDVTGIDFSTEMIAAAKRKAEKAGSKVTFIEGDAMDLPFPDGTFDACTVSFGLRNMPDYDAALASMMRILRPGGQLVCLEMTPFHRPVLGPLFKVYFERVMPLVGGLLSGSPSAYRYLPKSVEAFPSAHDLAERMKAVGLEEVSYALYGFGTVAIHQGRRPAEGAS